MCILIERTEKYVQERIDEGIFDVDEVCKVYMTRIEHLYYKVCFACCSNSSGCSHVALLLRSLVTLQVSENGGLEAIK